MPTKHFFIVYRLHTEDQYHRELVAVCDTLEQAVFLLDKPNFDLGIYETHFDEYGLIHTEIEVSSETLIEFNREQSNG